MKLLMAIAGFGALVSGLELAVQTMNGGIAVEQPRPMITAAPEYFPDLLRRQNDATSLCGYASGNGSSPVTCPAGNFCGFNSGVSAFGCCTGVQDASLVGCVLATTCYDSSSFALACGKSCQANTMNAWCTFPEYPYCRKYTTGIFSGFDCYSEPGQVEPMLPTPISGFSTLDFSQTLSSSTITPTTSSRSQTAQSTTSVLIEATPFSETQQTGSVAPTTSANPSGGAYRLLDDCLSPQVLFLGIGAWMVC